MTMAKLEVRIDIAATPGQIGDVVTTLRRTPEWCPQCTAMKPLGPVRHGSYTANMNRRGNNDR